MHRSRVFVLGCTVDMPARAAVLNMVQFNGIHGCPWCFTTATHQEGKCPLFRDGFCDGFTAYFNIGLEVRF